MRIRFVVLTVIAAALLVPAVALAASRAVVPFKSVAGMPLKLTPAEVIHRAGKPSHIIRVSGKPSEYDYASRHLVVMFDTLHHPIESDFVGVNGGRYHTVKGIHLGSTAASLHHAFGSSLKCQTGICTLFRGKPGSVNSSRTDFGLLQGKVQEMDIQYVFNDL